jgi:hypothetical protein
MLNGLSIAFKILFDVVLTVVTINEIYKDLNIFLKAAILLFPVSCHIITYLAYSHYNTLLQAILSMISF